MGSRARTLWFGLALLFGAAAAAAATDPAAMRRLLTLLAGIRDEYREALDDQGRLVAPREIEEARLLLREAHAQAERVGVGVPGDFAATLAAVAARIERTAPVDDVVIPIDELRAALSEASGVAADAGPPAPPSVERGRALFAENCAGCHGATGAGDGEEARHLAIEPADFSDAEFMRGETPQDFFNVISLGRRRSGMPAWEEALSIQQRWDLVRFTFTLAAEPEAGRAAWVAGCAGCHAEDAAGGAEAGGPDVPDLSRTLSLAQRTAAELSKAMTEGPHAALAMPAGDRARALAWLRDRSLGGGSAPGEAAIDDGEGSTAGLDEARRLLAAALEAARLGDERAGQLATDAYIAFEPFERRLRVTDAGAAARIEEAFLELRMLLNGTAPAGRVDALGRAIDADLAAAAARLAGQTSAGRWAIFVQAFAIILREGFEVILIVGALAAYVRRSGQAAMMRAIRSGVAAGLVASVATAAALVTLARNAAVAGEVLEGGALLLASLVLFWVSYWLLAKAEADRWQRYIAGKVEAALGRGSMLALGAAAFLAVYREGFETVLFYQALLAASGGAVDGVAAGFVAGAAALGLLWLAMARLGMRLPIARFFVVTGILLYGLAVVFAGQGVAELQEGGVVGVTPVAGVPTIPWLGVFPTWETVAAQGVLVALACVALVVLARRRARDAAASQRETPPRRDEADRSARAGGAGR